MAFIATVSSIGTFFICLALALWLVKEILFSKH